MFKLFIAPVLGSYLVYLIRGPDTAAGRKAVLLSFLWHALIYFMFVVTFLILTAVILVQFQ